MVSVDTHKLAGLLLSGLIGAGVGWAAQALTLSGRVHALETGQTAIMVRLDRLLLKAELQAATPAPSKP